MTVGGTDSVGVSASSLVEVVYLEERGRVPAGIFARISSALVVSASALVAIPVDAAGGGLHQERRQDLQATPAEYVVFKEGTDAPSVKNQALRARHRTTFSL